MLKIDKKDGDSYIKGPMIEIMEELTILIEHVAEEGISKGMFDDKYQMLDKVREGMHYADLMAAGMTTDEAYRAATGRDLTDKQKANADAYEKRLEEKDK